MTVRRRARPPDRCYATGRGRGASLPLPRGLARRVTWTRSVFDLPALRRTKGALRRDRPDAGLDRRQRRAASAHCASAQAARTPRRAGDGRDGRDGRHDRCGMRAGDRVFHSTKVADHTADASPEHRSSRSRAPGGLKRGAAGAERRLASRSTGERGPPWRRRRVRPCRSVLVAEVQTAAFGAGVVRNGLTGPGPAEAFSRHRRTVARSGSSAAASSMSQTVDR